MDIARATSKGQPVSASGWAESTLVAGSNENDQSPSPDTLLGEDGEVDVKGAQVRENDTMAQGIVA